MRPIDADALIKKCGDWYTEEGPEEGFIGTIEMLVNEQPDIEPKQGEWIDEHGNKVEIDENGCPRGWCHCSNCGEWLVASDEYEVKGNFCPNCGARMKGADDE